MKAFYFTQLPKNRMSWNWRLRPACWKNQSRFPEGHPPPRRRDRPPADCRLNRQHIEWSELMDLRSRLVKQEWDRHFHPPRGTGLVKRQARKDLSDFHPRDPYPTMRDRKSVV